MHSQPSFSARVVVSKAHRGHKTTLDLSLSPSVASILASSGILPKLCTADKGLVVSTDVRLTIRLLPIGESEGAPVLESCETDSWADFQ
jgi:hypothetical protein